MNNIFKNTKGSSIMFMTLVISASCLIIVVIVSGIVNNGLEMNKNQNNSTKAYFTAEAGAERILFEIRKNNIFKPPLSMSCSIGDNFCFDSSDVLNNCNSLCSLPYTSNQSVGNNLTYSLEYKNNSPITIQSIGDFNNEIKRTVEVSY